MKTANNNFNKIFRETVVKSFSGKEMMQGICCCMICLCEGPVSR